jgi:hypothetical protein
MPSPSPASVVLDSVWVREPPRTLHRKPTAMRATGSPAATGQAVTKAVPVTAMGLG